MTSKIVLGFVRRLVFAAAFLASSPCFAQPQEVREEIYFGQARSRPSTSTNDIRKALSKRFFESKEFTDADNKKRFSEFAEKLRSTVSAKGKEVDVVIDRNAFWVGEKETYEIDDAEITLPRIPTKMVANTALRLCLSQVGNGDATHMIRRGQIVITSNKTILAGKFVDSEVVATFKQRRLVDAMDELAEFSGVSIIVDQRIRKKAQTLVTAKFNGAKLRAAVQILADTAELKSVVVDNVIYVTSPDNARQFKGPTAHPLSYTTDTFWTQKDRPVAAAIEDFTHGNLVIDGRIKDKTNIRVNARWYNTVQWDTALRILTDMAGLQHVVVEDIVYVTSPANAKKLDEENRKKP